MTKTHDHETINNIANRIAELERKISDLKCADNVELLARKRIHERLANIEKHAADGLEALLQLEKRHDDMIVAVHMDVGRLGETAEKADHLVLKNVSDLEKRINALEK